ncbi:thiamine pyrophosphate-dependent dehydrogenase E1 component subunit alpha [uncultured Microbacterium sp.]|uniref:thiamine pyrophosphate-dependent dehydrogenase E1 component subunit alpha n=1 Tax=uncultured Microbacterium sp. TaxID=191216 RepID=UPI0035CA6DE7
MIDTLVDRYRTMRLMREFEQTCLRGVAEGHIHGELHAGIGQEAIGAGMSGHLRDSDAMVSTHRNHLHALAKNVPLRPLLAEIFERSTGLCGGFGGHMHIFDKPRKFSTTGIVGASLPVALGHAYAAKISARDDVAVAVAGDGSINTGGFAETMNMAGVLKLPLVVVIENNEWAISVPFSASSATPTLAERAPAFGAVGLRIDGLDVEAVSDAFGAAVARARAGGGPQIIEAMCYRFRGHYEGDLDMYRDREEKDHRLANADPMLLCRSRILQRTLLTDQEIDRIDSEIRERMAGELAAVLDDPFPDGATAREHVFASDLELHPGARA